MKGGHVQQVDGNALSALGLEVPGEVVHTAGARQKQVTLATKLDVGGVILGGQRVLEIGVEIEAEPGHANVLGSAHQAPHTAGAGRC